MPLEPFSPSVMAEDSESAASQQSLELDDQDTCGIDGDNEEENEHTQGYALFFYLFILNHSENTDPRF